MSTYIPNHFGHRTMRLLGAERLQLWQIADGIDSAWSRRKVIRKLGGVAKALREDGFVDLGVGGFALTAEGLAALRDLNEGRRVFTGAVPTVRVFRQEAA